MKKIIKIILITILTLITIILVTTLAINQNIYLKTKNKIITEQSEKIENVDCILILGAGIWNNRPSPMLEDRLLQGISLYQKGFASKIIMSGDHGRKNYDEVNIMKEFAIERGVNSEDIFMDHAGFSTYESIYRAKEIFGAKKMIIVTQEYHLYRALYIAQQFDIETYGVASNPREYMGQFAREVREWLARDKEFFKCIYKPKPTYLGDTIPVSGNGDITNDKEEVEK